jgi:integrase
MTDASQGIVAVASGATVVALPLPEAATARPEGDVFETVLRWQRTLDVSGRCNANTRRQYRRTLIAFLADVLSDPGWTGCRDPFALTEDDMVAYLEGIDPKGGARAMKIRTLRSYYGWLAEREDAAGAPLIHRNPMRHIHPKDRKYGAAPALTPEELDHVLSCAERVDPRARWAIQLQYATVCRAGSLVAAEPRDIERTPAGPILHFREAKNDDPYTVPLGPTAQQAVEQLLALMEYTPKRATRRPTLIGVGYSAYESWVKRTEDLAGVRLYSHLLRHTAITRLSEDPTIDVRTIMAMANWKDPRLLDRYAAKSDRRMRRASGVL